MASQAKTFSVITKNGQGFQIHLKELKKDSSVKAVHQMRVFSRRLRTNLWIFKDRLGKKKYRALILPLDHIVRGLGPIRDLDIHFNLLKQFKGQSPDPQIKKGISRLMKDLKIQRKSLQSQIDKVLKGVKKSDLIPSLMRTIHRLKKKFSPWDTRKLLKRSPLQVNKRLQDLLSYTPYIHKPQKVQKLHAMRMASKRLRFTLENFEPLLGEKLKPSIQSAQAFQTHLGAFHDYDVWLEHLASSTSKKNFRQADPQGRTRAFLIQQCQKLKRQSYQSFLNTWQKCQKKKTWKRLKNFIASQGT